jgi:hypothetical protein
MKKSLKQHGDGEYAIRVARNLQEVESWRDLWQKMQWHHNADIDYYLTVVNSRKEILRPHVILLCRNGPPEALVIGRIEEVKFESKIGYHVIHGPAVRALTVVYGGILGEPTYSGCVALVGELCRALAEGEAEIAVLNHLRLDSMMYQVATTMPAFPYRDHGIVPNLHWRISLPGSYEEFYRALSRKTRENVRRHANRVTQKYGTDLSIRCFREIGEADQIVTDVESIASKTYHRGLGVGFVANAETIRRIRLALERQWFHSYILYLNGEPCAFQNGIKYGDIFYLAGTGYDPAYHADGLGNFLLIRTIEELCREGDSLFLDFGFGDAEYKRRYSNQCWQEATVSIFAPTSRGAMLNAMQSMTAAINQLLKSASSRLGMLDQIKSKWRKRLTPNQSDHKEAD